MLTLFGKEEFTMGKKMLLCGLLAGLMLVSAPGLATAAVVQFDFNTDGVKPHDEALAIDAGSTVGRFSDGRTGDVVAGGLWKQENPPADADPTDGTILYHGNIPALATTDTSLPLSINTRIRFNESIGAHSGSTISGEFYLNMRSAGGTIWLYFDYDKNTGESKISGRSHPGGSGLFRDLPNGALGEFHDLAITWDPADGTGVTAKLWFDGAYIGDTYASTAITNTNGNVELGDGINGSSNGMFEVDYIRFGTDLTVIPEPASMLLLLGGAGWLKLRRRRN
jgi:hypothetical protein